PSALLTGAPCTAVRQRWGLLLLPNLPIRGEVPGRGGWAARQDLFQELRDVDAVLDRRIELETKVGRELEVLEAAAQLVPDQALRRNQASDRRLLLVRIAEHGHAPTRLARVSGLPHI